MKVNEELEPLIVALGKLPALGRRSSERIAIHLLTQRSRQKLRGLVEALQRADAQIGICPVCGLFTVSGQAQCPVCAETGRDGTLLCVVENPGDALLIERAGGFNGRYHVLGGRIAPMRGEGVKNVGAEALLQRIRRQHVEEVLLALGTEVESDATAAYLRDALHGEGLRVTRMAMGVPAGSSVAYADEHTLHRAIVYRQEV